MSDPITEHRRWIGGRIREARKHADLSHDRLAAKVGTTRQHLIKLEKGDHLPRPALLDAIAVATGVGTDWFRPAPGRDRASDAVEAA